ncbi:AraC family transcriptional regulator [Alcanivorax sp. S6407]|uniref:helix-turn-helix transcriptional regulator n=1 Tax=Alcanivorax sp. S6407 TaxID=2926424 RepID=UPI001FF61168|nr:AraC family transcriptional regulator [Alcanivorax sp. S6407]MCK0153094.1 AraC family transcriptional regulator [Alcanivorax sp. S6407]
MATDALPFIPARYYARLGELLAGQGLDVEAIHAKAGIAAQTLADPEGRLSLPQVEGLIAEVYRVAPDFPWAFELGRSLKLSSHGMLGYAMLSSPNLDYVFQLLARYFRIIMPTFRLQYRRGGEQDEVLLTVAAGQSALCLQFHIEAIAVAWHWEILSLLQGQMPAYDLYLSTGTPRHLDRYGALKPARWHFGWPIRPGFRILYPRGLVNRELAMADPGALKLAERQCSELAQQTLKEGRLVEWVTAMLTYSRDVITTREELAALLNISPRTLDRRLLDEGASFRELSRQIRFQRACELIRAGQLSMLEIALELGYRDSANFTRAFRREAGCAPSQWLAAQSA